MPAAAIPHIPMGILLYLSAWYSDRALQSCATSAGGSGAALTDHAGSRAYCHGLHCLYTASRFWHQKHQCCMHPDILNAYLCAE
jgi:hypothetical protein